MWCYGFNDFNKEIVLNEEFFFIAENLVRGTSTHISTDFLELAKTLGAREPKNLKFSRTVLFYSTNKKQNHC